MKGNGTFRGGFQLDWGENKEKAPSNDKLLRAFVARFDLDTRSDLKGTTTEYIQKIHLLREV